MISARALVRTFGEKTALRGIDLDVADGELFGLMGRTAPARARSSGSWRAC